MTANIVEELKSARLELTRHQAREAKADADLQELRTAQALREEQHYLCGDDIVHEHYFTGPVDERTVHHAAQHMALWHRLDPTCDMNLVVHSPGGSVLAGLNLFDQLSAYSVRGGGTHHVTITIRGLAASMAGILVQAADERVIGPESYLMIHELSAQTGGKIGEIKDAMKFYERLGERIADIYVNRSGGRITLPEFKAMWTDRDVYLDSSQALAYGFVDRIG